MNVKNVVTWFAPTNTHFLRTTNSRYSIWLVLYSAPFVYDGIANTVYHRNIPWTVFSVDTGKPLLTFFQTNQWDLPMMGDHSTICLFIKPNNDSFTNKMQVYIHMHTHTQVFAFKHKKGIETESYVGQKLLKEIGRDQGLVRGETSLLILPTRSPNILSVLSRLCTVLCTPLPRNAQVVTRLAKPCHFLCPLLAPPSRHLQWVQRHSTKQVVSGRENQLVDLARDGRGRLHLKLLQTEQNKA